MDNTESIPAKAYIGQVSVEWTISDDYAFVKYLESDIDNLGASMRYTENDVEEYGEDQVKQWIREDTERLNDWKRGEWWMAHATPKATITIETNTGKQLTSTVEAPGVGGVASDTPKEDLEQVESDVLLELKHILKEMGFSSKDIYKAGENYETIDNAALGI